jgi:hypothetical protein
MVKQFTRRITYQTLYRHRADELVVIYCREGWVFNSSSRETQGLPSVKVRQNRTTAKE